MSAIDDPVILGIETSCDETAAAVVTGGRTVLSNVIASQHELHEQYAGVVPEIASRAHLERILPIIREAVETAGLTLPEIQAIAVGNRPGLIGSLLVGVSAAKALAWTLGVPVIGVDHIAAHLYAGLLEREPPRFPALGLVVSGGHTSLMRLESPLEISILGQTIDDAVGEAYDKAATILQIGYPGGPKLDRLATQGNDRAHDLPVSMLGRESLDFSFSGLKTAFLYAVCGRPEGRGRDARLPRDAATLSDSQRADFAASFQRVAVTTIMKKVRRTLDRYPLKTLLVGGGVSANSRLRSELQSLADEHSLDLRLPPLEYCLDNAAMIAGIAAARYHAGAFDDLSLSAAPRTGIAAV